MPLLVCLSFFAIQPQNPPTHTHKHSQCTQLIIVRGLAEYRCYYNQRDTWTGRLYYSSPLHSHFLHRSASPPPTHPIPWTAFSGDYLNAACVCVCEFYGCFCKTFIFPFFSRDQSTPLCAMYPLWSPYHHWRYKRALSRVHKRHHDAGRLCSVCTRGTLLLAVPCPRI